MPGLRVLLTRDLHSSLSFRLARKLTFGRARRLLGLGRCKQFLSMGAGLPRATLDFFLSLDIPIYELYGLSESTGVHTLTTHQDFRLLRWAWPRVGGRADEGQMEGQQRGAGVSWDPHLGTPKTRVVPGCHRHPTWLSSTQGRMAQSSDREPRAPRISVWICKL